MYNLNKYISVAVFLGAVGLFGTMYSMDQIERQIERLNMIELIDHNDLEDKVVEKYAAKKKAHKMYLENLDKHLQVKSKKYVDDKLKKTIVFHKDVIELSRKYNQPEINNPNRQEEAILEGGSAVEELLFVEKPLLNKSIQDELNKGMKFKKPILDWMDQNSEELGIKAIDEILDHLKPFVYQTWPDPSQEAPKHFVSQNGLLKFLNIYRESAPKNDTKTDKAFMACLSQAYRILLATRQLIYEKSNELELDQVKLENNNIQENQ